MATSDAAGANDEFEAKARADFAAGRWRKARDAFKQLCKSDRGTFLPLLIDANMGLARDMLAKGRLSDARQVFAYLKTLAPPSVVAELHRSIEASIPAPVHIDARSPAPAPLSLLAGKSGTPAERTRWADDLVLAFNPAPSNGSNAIDANSGPEEIAADLAAVHDAIEAVCQGNQDRALDLVRPLKRESPFAHWRLFV
ncbi:MAG: hypothetical protein ABI442_21670, partial [Gemmatimonadaceae bacterium]